LRKEFLSALGRDLGFVARVCDPVGPGSAVPEPRLLPTGRVWVPTGCRMAARSARQRRGFGGRFCCHWLSTARAGSRLIRNLSATFGTGDEGHWLAPRISVGYCQHLGSSRPSLVTPLGSLSAQWPGLPLGAGDCHHQPGIASSPAIWSLVRVPARYRCRWESIQDRSLAPR
jgi:hypothetical protein